VFVTMGDGFIVHKDKDILHKRVNDFLAEGISGKVLTEKYNLGKNYAEWIVKNKKDISNNQDKIVPFAYRPFDDRYTYFDNKLVWRPRTNTMKHLVSGKILHLKYVAKLLVIGRIFLLPIMLLMIHIFLTKPENVGILFLYTSLSRTERESQTLKK